MTPNDRIVSLIRTVVPAAAGSAITWLAANVGFLAAWLNSLEQAELLAFYAGLATVATGLYYEAVKVLEKRWPIVGKLLGWKAQVTYTQPE